MGTIPTWNQDTTGNAATVTTNANLTGDVTSTGNSTAIATGVIVDADINASAGIAYSKMGTIPTWNQSTTGNAASLTGLNATVTELNIMDGGTAATATTVVDADRVVLNDNGDMKQVTVQDMDIYYKNQYFGDGSDGALTVASGSACPALCDETASSCSVCTLPLNSTFGGNGKALYAADYSFTSINIGTGTTLKVANVAALDTGGCADTHGASGQNIVLRSLGTVTIDGTVDMSARGACGGTNIGTHSDNASSPGGSTYASGGGAGGSIAAGAGGQGGNADGAFGCSSSTQSDCVFKYGDATTKPPVTTVFDGRNYSALHGTGGAKGYGLGAVGAGNASGAGSGAFLASIGAGGGGSAKCDNGPSNVGGTRGGGGILVIATDTIDIGGGTFKTGGVDGGDDDPTGGGGSIVLQSLTSVTGTATYDTEGGTIDSTPNCTHTSSSSTLTPGKGGYGAALHIKMRY